MIYYLSLSVLYSWPRFSIQIDYFSNIFIFVFEKHKNRSKLLLFLSPKPAAVPGTNTDKLNLCRQKNCAITLRWKAPDYYPSSLSKFIANRGRIVENTEESPPHCARQPLTCYWQIWYGWSSYREGLLDNLSVAPLQYHAAFLVLPSDIIAHILKDMIHTQRHIMHW